MNNVKYCLCLDESGSFLNENGSSLLIEHCIVGGILFKENLFSPNNALKFYNYLEKKFKDYKNILYHSTDLLNEVLSLNATEANNFLNIKYSVLKGLTDKGIQFVIFENQYRISVIDSNTTYLYMIANGVVQLVTSLIIENNCPVELRCVIGKRIDTKNDKQKMKNNEQDTENDDKYINISEYENRINERIAIEKALINNPYLRESVISIELVNDKKDKRVIFADHVCHYRFTRQNIIYNNYIEVEGEKAKAKIIFNEMFEEAYIFPFNISNEEKYVKSCLSIGSYTDLLLNICYGNIKKQKNIDLIINTLSGLEEIYLENALNSLILSINNSLQIFRNLPKIEALLYEAQSKIELPLLNSKKKILRFRIDLKTLLLTVYSHQARLSDMKKLFDETYSLIVDYSKENMDMQYMSIYRNRLAVYLQDIFDFEGSIKICEKQSALFSLLNDAVLLDDSMSKYENDIQNSQLGKVLGTELQAYTVLIKRKPTEYTYEKGVELSDLAMKQFESISVYDLERQYQYRALFESSAGNFEEAIEYIEKYFHCTWMEWFKMEKCEIFGLMNLLKIADDMHSFYRIKSKMPEIKQYKQYRDFAISIAKESTSYIDNKINDIGNLDFPQLIVLLRAGRILLNSNQYKKKGKEYLRKVTDERKKESENSNATYDIIALEALLALMQDNIRESHGGGNSKERFINKCDNFLDNYDDVFIRMKDEVQIWKADIKNNKLVEYLFIY